MVGLDIICQGSCCLTFSRDIETSWFSILFRIFSFLLAIVWSSLNFNNISFTNAAISPVGGASPGIAHFTTSSVSSGADLDTAGHWLYGAFFDGNHTSGTAPASVGGTFRFEDAANTGYGAFFFAATKD